MRKLCVLFLLLLFVIGCAHELAVKSDDQIRSFVEANPELREMLKNQPNVLVIKSIILVNTTDLKYAECKELKSSKTYKVTLNFNVIPSSSFEPYVYVDPKSGMSCYNSEKKMFPDRCSFDNDMYCTGMFVTGSTTEFNVTGKKDINKVKFASSHCTGTVTADVKKESTTTITFTACENTVNYIEQFRDELEARYEDSGNEITTKGSIVIRLRT